MNDLKSLMLIDQNQRRGLLLLLLVALWGALLTVGGGRWMWVLVLPALLVGLRLAWGKLPWLVGWSVVPISLLYWPSTDLPLVDSLWLLMVLLLLSLIAERQRVRLTNFAFMHMLLLGLFAASTLASVFAVRSNGMSGLMLWVEAIFPLIAIGGFALLSNAGPEILKNLSLAAKPASFIFGALALTEYVLNKSLYGVASFRSLGFDRRVLGPFGSAEVFGLMFCFLLALNVYRMRSTVLQKTNTWLVMTNWLSLLACVLGGGLTFFRSAWLGLAAVLLVALLTTPKPGFSARPFRLAAPLFPLLGATMVLCAVLVWNDRQMIAKTIQSTPLIDTIGERVGGGSSKNSAGNRSTLLKSAWLMLQDHPLTGIGFGQFPTNTHHYVPQDLSAEQFQTVYYANEIVGGLVAHNSYAQVAGESGIVALLALLGLHLQPLVWAWRIRRDNKNLFALVLMLTAALLITNLTQSTLYYGTSALVWFALVFGCLMQLRETVVEFEV